MEEIKDKEVHATYFCECVKAIQQAEKEAERQVREGYTRLGLEMPKERDTDKPMTLRERLGI